MVCGRVANATKRTGDQSMTRDWQYRLTVLSRTVAGFGGGYVLTSLIVGFLSLCLPGHRASSVLFATMPAFLIYALVVMTVFHVRSVVRAWIWIACGSALIALLIFLPVVLGLALLALSMPRHYRNLS